MQTGNPKSTSVPIAGLSGRRGMRRARGQSADFVYDHLRADILTLAIGPGEELDESTLSTRFAVSRTPVREALIRLAADKLVILSRNRRATVPALDLAGFPGYLEALDLLQRAVTRLAAERRSEADVAAIRKSQADYDRALGDIARGGPESLAAVETNLRFHRAIADAAQSPHLADAYYRVLVEGVRYMSLSFSVHDPGDQGHGPHMRNVTREHEAMIEAIAAGDVDAAERLAHDHVTLFRRRITAYLERSGTAKISAVV